MARRKSSSTTSAPSPTASATPRDKDASPTADHPATARAGSYSLRTRGRPSTGPSDPKKPSSDASSLSSLSDSESDGDDKAKKSSDLDEYHDEYAKPQPVVVIKRKPGRPRKIQPPLEVDVPEPERAPRVQPVAQTDATSLPSPASQTSPPVRNLKRIGSNPPATAQPTPVPTTQVLPPPVPFSHHQPSPPAAGTLAVDSSTPLLSHILSRVHDLIQDARIEAGRDEANQTKSQDAVEGSIISLPSREHRSALCLTMNRYSAFCAASSFDVPAFPITAYKVALFLARASPSPVGRTLLRSFPQPDTFPLPLAAGLDGTPMGKNEGDVLSRELVQSWIEALGYAQSSTAHLWQHTHVTEVLLDAPLLKELLGTFDKLADVRRARKAVGVGELELNESEGRRSAESSGESSRKKTKWVRGGRAVDAPKMKLSGSPPLGNLSPSISPSMLSMQSPLAGPASNGGPSSEFYYQQHPSRHQQTPYPFAPHQPVPRGFDPNNIGGYGQPAPGYRAQPTYLPVGNYGQPLYPPPQHQHAQPPQHYYSSVPAPTDAEPPANDAANEEPGTDALAGQSRVPSAGPSSIPMPMTRPPPSTAQWYAPPSHGYAPQQVYNPSAAPGYAMQYSSSSHAGYYSSAPPAQNTYYNAPPAPYRSLPPPPGMTYADPSGGQFAYSPTTTAAFGYAGEGR